MDSKKSLLIGSAVVVAIVLGVLIGLTYPTAIIASIPAVATVAPATTGSPEMVEKPETETASQMIETPVAPESTGKSGIYKYITIKAEKAQSVNGLFVAPDGYTYVVLTVTINNTGTGTISTNPFYWEFIDNGITYQPDVATFSEGVSTPIVDVGPGGHTIARIAYLVQGVNPQGSYQVRYTGPTTRYGYY